MNPPKNPRGKSDLALRNLVYQRPGRVCPLLLVGVDCRSKSGARVRHGGDDPVCICDIHYRYYLDHGEIWVDGGGRPVVITAHVYDLEMKDLQALSVLTRDLPLTVSVSAKSWWFPGGTVLVEIWLDSERRKEMEPDLHERAAGVVRDAWHKHLGGRPCDDHVRFEERFRKNWSHICPCPSLGNIDR